MKYLSLFSGIGGFELGIQQAYENRNANRSENGGVQKDSQRDKGQGFLSSQGQEVGTEKRPVSERTPDIFDERPLCIGYSEIDKYATQIYEKHFNHKNYGDITKINEKELPDFDLLVGGFPCQAFSIAGKRRGFEDTRGTLFFDIARIVREKQPRLLVLENVKGLLSHDKGNTFTTIISTLDELGYDLQWQVLNSKNHGVPQNRERVFIIGHLRGTSRPQVFPFGEDDTSIIEQCNEDFQESEVAQTLTATYWKGGKGSQIQQLNQPKHSQQRVYDPTGIAPTLSAGNLGGGKSPSKILQLNQPKHSNDRVYGTDGVSPTLNTAQGGNRQPFIKQINSSKESNGVQPYQQNRVYSENGGVPALNAELGGRNNVFTDSKIRRLTPTECERLQGFPDGWTEGLSDTQRYKTLGNAVTVNVIKDIFTKLK